MFLQFHHHHKFTTSKVCTRHKQSKLLPKHKDAWKQTVDSETTDLVWAERFAAVHQQLSELCWSFMLVLLFLPYFYDCHCLKYAFWCHLLNVGFIEVTAGNWTSIVCCCDGTMQHCCQPLSPLGFDFSWMSTWYHVVYRLMLLALTTGYTVCTVSYYCSYCSNCTVHIAIHWF